MSREPYRLSTCPVPVWSFDNANPADDHAEPCGAEVSIEIHVHEDGAEYGVWADGTTTCGHTLRDIAHVEQYGLMGVDLY